MKKIFTGRTSILALLFILFISVAFFMAYIKHHTSSGDKDSCCKEVSATGSEMLWDVLSRQFVPAVHIQ
jgi:hypothetical protein